MSHRPSLLQPSRQEWQTRNCSYGIFYCRLNSELKALLFEIERLMMVGKIRKTTLISVIQGLWSLKIEALVQSFDLRMTSKSKWNKSTPKEDPELSNSRIWTSATQTLFTITANKALNVPQNTLISANPGLMARNGGFLSLRSPKLKCIYNSR